MTEQIKAELVLDDEKAVGPLRRIGREAKKNLGEDGAAAAKGLGEAEKQAAEQAAKLAREIGKLNAKAAFAEAKAASEEYRAALAKAAEAQRQLNAISADASADPAKSLKPAVETVKGLGDEVTKTTAKMPPFQSQLSQTASAIMGPLGVATGLAMATNRLISFAEANATTDEQRAEFEAFRTAIEGVKTELGGALAQVLTSSGALDGLGKVAETVSSQIGAVLKILDAMGPVLEIFGIGLDIALAPLNALISAGDWLVDTLTDVAGGLLAESGSLEESADAAKYAERVFYELEASQRTLNATVAAHNELRRTEARLVSQARAEAQRANDAEKSRSDRVAEAADLARKGQDSIRLNEEKLRAASADATAVLNERERALSLMTEASPGYVEAVDAQKRAWQDAMDIQGALEGLEAKRRVSMRETTATVDKDAIAWRERGEALLVVLQAVQSEGPAYLEWMRAYNEQQQELAAQSRDVSDSISALFGGAGEEEGGIMGMVRAISDGIGEANAALGAYDAELSRIEQRNEEFAESVRASIGDAFVEAFDQVASAGTSFREVMTGIIGGLIEELATAFSAWALAEGALLAGQPWIALGVVTAMKIAGRAIKNFGKRSGGGSSTSNQVERVAAKRDERKSEPMRVEVNLHGIPVPDKTAHELRAAIERSMNLRG